MIVLAESNFVLELAFQQKEAQEAGRIVEMAEGKRIELVIPACALFEPHETLIRRERQRDETVRKLTSELQQLARSNAFADLQETATIVINTLKNIGGVEAKDLAEVVRRLLKCSVVLPLSDSIIERALEVQSEFNLGPQDAVVFATVDQHLQERVRAPKVFINKNQRDFCTPGIETHFEQFECKVLPKFSTARQFIESRL